MTDLDQGMKEKIIKLIEFVFEPIKGKVTSFEEPYDMYYCVGARCSSENIITEKYKVTSYPFVVSTELGELSLTVPSNELNDISSAVGNAYLHSNPNELKGLSSEISFEIQKRIYTYK